MTDVAWKSVPGFPSYEVSSTGDLRRTTRFRHYPAGMLLKRRRDRHGYLQVALSHAGRYSYFGVHRLVALAFLGEPPTRQHQAAHNDGNRVNNNLSNLRWATPSENSLDRNLHGTNPDRRGELHPMATLTDDLVIELRDERRSGRRYAELARLYNLPKLTLYDAITGTTWRHLPGAVGARRRPETHRDLSR